MLNLYATVVNGKPSVSQLQGNSLAYIEEILETKDIKTYDIVVAWGNSMATHKNKGKKAMVPGAKWNVILTGAMMKAMTQEMTEVTKVRKEVNKAYSQKINEVKTNE